MLSAEVDEHRCSDMLIVLAIFLFTFVEQRHKNAFSHISLHSWISNAFSISYEIFKLACCCWILLTLEHECLCTYRHQ